MGIRTGITREDVVAGLANFDGGAIDSEPPSRNEPATRGTGVRVSKRRGFD